MEVREARPEEYDAIGALTWAAYVEGGHVAPEHDYAHRLRDAATRAREALLLVAIEDGEALGTVTYCPHGSPWREIANADEGEFRTLAVSPAARRRGAADALVRRCLELSRCDGDAGMVLSTLPDQVAAHRLYQRLGFARRPERDWSPVAGVELLAYAVTHPLPGVVR